MSVCVCVICIVSSVILWQRQCLPSANEVCKGYVFTGVCLFAGGRSLSGGLCLEGFFVWGFSVLGEGSMSGGSLSGGSLSGGSLSGGSLSGGSLSERSLSGKLPGVVMCGWYASYWNAFFLFYFPFLASLPKYFWQIDRYLVFGHFHQKFVFSINVYLAY